MDKILHKVISKGININNIILTYPAHTCFFDAYKHSIGGDNNEGLAWCYKLSDHLIENISINLLEFIAAAVTIHLTIRSARSGVKLLAFTDNSSTLG